MGLGLSDSKTLHSHKMCVSMRTLGLCRDTKGSLEAGTDRLSNHCSWNSAQGSCVSSV